MGRHPSSNAMTREQMTDMQERKSGRIYKEISDENRRLELSALAKRMKVELSDARKIDLTKTDFEMVREQVMKYFTACEISGTLPSLNGLARAFGYTRAGFNNFLNMHSWTKNAEFLELVRDAISDALDVAALSNTVNSVMAIFIQKSIHNRVDKAELLITPLKPHNPLGETPSKEEIMARYGDMVAEIE